MKEYFWNILIGLDQSIGTLFGINADMTISGWVGYKYPGTWMERTLDAIFGAGHCKKSIEYDVIERLHKQGKLL